MKDRRRHRKSHLPEIDTDERVKFRSKNPVIRVQTDDFPDEALALHSRSTLIDVLCKNYNRTSSIIIQKLKKSARALYGGVPRSLR